MLCGREREQAVLDGLLDGLSSGRGGVAVLEGEAGIGKTALLSDTARRAEAMGIAHRGTSAEPFDAIRPLSLLLPLVQTELGAKARHLWTARRDHEPSIDTTSSLIEDVMDAVEHAALSAPLLVTVDDAQWSDAVSARVLVSLARRAEALPMVLIVALRHDRRSGAFGTEPFTALCDAGEVLVLEPLTAEALSALAADAFGRVPSREELAVIDDSGGNPFLAHELLAMLPADGSVPEALPLVSDSAMRDVVLARFGVFDEDTYEVLRIAAVLGPSFSVGQLSAATGRRASALLRPLERAEEVGVIERRSISDHTVFAFRHSVVREVLYNELSPSVRVAMHAEIADELEQAGAAPTLVASHLRLGADPGARGDAMLFLRSAEQIANEVPEIAVDLAERAVRSLGPGPEGDRATAVLVKALCWSGRVDDAAAAAREAIRTTADRDHARALLTSLFEARFFAGAISEVLQDAIEHYGGEDSLPPMAQAGMAWADVFQLDLEACGPHADRAVATARSVGADDALVMALVCRAMARGLAGGYGEMVDDSLAAIEIADASPNGELHRFNPRTILGVAYDARGDADALVEVVRVLHTPSNRSPGAAYLASIHTLQSVAAFRAGSWDDAVAEAEAQLIVADDLGLRINTPWVHAVLGVIAVHRGDHDRARAAVRSAEAEMAGGGLMGRDFVIWAHALLLEAEGDPATALETLGSLADDAAAVGVRQTIAVVAPDLARLARAAGDERRLAGLQAVTEELAAMNPGCAVFAARVAMARGDLEEAVEALRSTSRRVELAQAAAEAALALAAGDQRDRAVALAEEAATVFADVGSSLWLDRLSPLLARSTANRRTPAPGFGWGALTASEWRVVRLVADGRTNVEVANEMGNSKRTVEAHLRHVFTKLDVSTRTELTRRYATRHDA